MVIELRIKVLRIWSAQGQHGLSIQTATKRILCRSPQLVLCCYVLSHHFVFQPLCGPLCHVCLWGFLRQWFVICEATLCQVAVALSAPPRTTHSPKISSLVVRWWLEGLCWDENRIHDMFCTHSAHILLVFLQLLQQEEKNLSASFPALSLEESLSSCTALFLCLV